MKKIKSMEYVLSLGAFILLFSGIALVMNDSFSSLIVRVSGMAILTVFLMVLSIISDKVLHVENSSKISYCLSLIALIISYVLMGCNSIFGNWFSIDGDGAQIFLASIAILMAVLSIITIVKYKNYNLIHITFIALLVAMFHTFTYFNINFQIALIIVGCMLVLLNFIKVNKVIEDFVSVAIYVFMMISLLFGYDESFLLSSILLLINMLGIINALFKYKDFENQLMSLILFGINVFVFIDSSLNVFDTGVIVVISSFVICLLDLFINCFKLMRKRAVKILYKGFTSIFFIYLIALGIEEYLGSLTILSFFMLITSFINSFAIKNNDYEEYLFPFKICITLGILYSFLNTFIVFNEIFFYAIVSLVLAFFYKVSKKSCFKIEYMIINIIILILLGFSKVDCSLSEYIVIVVAYFINYLIIAYKKSGSEYNVFYTTILTGLVLVSSNLVVGSIEYLILSLIIGLCLGINFKNKYNFTISAIALLYSLDMYISGIIVSEDIYLMVISALYFIFVGVVSEVLFENIKAKDTFVSILCALGLFYLFRQNSTLIVNLYMLIVSLIMVFVSLKNKSYKILYYVGLISSVINVLCLIRFLDGLPVALYLLIIGMVIIIAVSIMIYKYQTREKDIVEKTDIKTNIQNIDNVEKQVESIQKSGMQVEMYKNNYCGVCGNKLNENENFCGTCGKRLK